MLHKFKSTIGFTARSLAGINRTQRLVLYGAVSIWFMVFILAHQINYQDSWILENIFWPFVGFIVVFLWILARENDNRFVAITCAWATTLIALIPALKYQQPYGVAIDATEHYLMIDSLLKIGEVQQGHVYASIAGMHAWLASLGITGGFEATEIIKFGPPLLGGIIPLIVYWLCRRVALPSERTRYILGTFCLAIYPYHLPTGTGFTLAPLLMLLGVLVVREYYCTSKLPKLALTLMALLGCLQLVVWHSVTPMILPLVLVAVSLTPAIVWFIKHFAGAFKVADSFLRFALLSTVLFVAYHIAEADQVYEVVTSTAYRLVNTQETSTIVPQRVFEITMLDILQVALVMHGRDLVLMGLTVLGLFVVWRYREQWERWGHFYVYLMLVCLTFYALVVTALGGVDYGRFIVASLIVSPFFAGTALWWLNKKLLRKFPCPRWAQKMVWSLAVALLVCTFMMQFFIYQPLVPKASAITLDTPTEYVVWLHTVNSAYQQRMLNFAETNTYPETRFAIDVEGISQYMRYFGRDAVAHRGLDSPLHWHKPIDDNVKLYLLHWAGPGGALGEQVEQRSVANLIELRQTPGWGLIYDNGESFILQVR